MTPRELRMQLLNAYEVENTQELLYLVGILKDKGWWIWEGKSAELNGKETLRIAQYDGHCQVCDGLFRQGSKIRWAGGRCSHTNCWDKQFGTTQ